MKKYYITTPLYYPNNTLHIGHAYTTVMADVLSRYKKLQGYDVKFLTGTDEHGQKIEKSALDAGITPQVHVDKMADWIKDLWQIMNIEYDIFIRTTDSFHIEAVKKIFKTLYDKGDIYKGYYEGNYCTPCELFSTDKQLVNGNCPDCNRPTEKVKEESYFFKLSKYQDKLLKHIEDNPNFIRPESRKNEMINNFIKPGLEDLSVSRTSLKWGVPVDFDENHTVYVWIDALSNYITGLGYNSDNTTDFEKFWPADVHLMAKEIVRFHTIIWPCILLALDIELPKTVYGHGWLVLDGGKISKSSGNIIDPKILIEKYGVDAIRYYLMSQMSYGQDSNYSEELLISRINSDLANDLGNLLSRTVGMISKYFGEKLPTEQKGNPYDADIIKFAKKTVENVEKNMEAFHISESLGDIWTFIRRCNKYIDETTPWILAKDETKKDELAGIMHTLAEALRIIAILISPTLPNTKNSIASQLSIDSNLLNSWDKTVFGLLPKEVMIKRGEIVFPRIEIVKQEIKEEPKQEDYITIDDFDKVNLKIGEVISCEKVPKSDKLLKSQIKIGDEVRQIVSGIATWYSPEDMVGKKVVVVTNLKPVKLRGVMSEGMILAASDSEGNLEVITANSIQNGAEVR